jgi:integrase
MARQRSTIPTYQKHSSGRARVRTYDGEGNRVEIILPGEYGSEQSKQEYARILATINAGNGLPTKQSFKHDITIDELALKYLEHAHTYYVDQVTRATTNEVVAIECALRPLCRMYGDQPAAEFGPLALQTVRKAMIEGTWLSQEEQVVRNKNGQRRDMARTTLNRNIGRIKLMFKWGSSQEIVPASVYHALATVSGLRRGRCAARETEPVKPVSSAIIDDTLPHLPPVVRDMVEILLLTGMRCGELVLMRACDLDMTGDVWLYRPERHKGLWRGKERVIAIGPRAQSLIKKYLGTKLDAYLFSPAAQEEMLAEAKRAKRKTPLWPSHVKHQAAKLKPSRARKPGERFTVGSVNRSVRRACERADIEHWHVHQLRHSASLTFSREMGLESARAALGHATVNMSAMYAGHDVETAKKVAAKVG